MYEQPLLLVTTVSTMKDYCVFCSSTGSHKPQKSNFLSTLAQHFPFVFNFLKKKRQPSSSQARDSPGSANLEDMHSRDYGKTEVQVDVALVNKGESSEINREEMQAFAYRNPNDVHVST